MLPPSSELNIFCEVNDNKIYIYARYCSGATFKYVQRNYMLKKLTQFILYGYEFTQVNYDELYDVVQNLNKNFYTKFILAVRGSLRKSLKSVP